MKFIHKAEEALLVTLFLVAVVVLTAQILSRYVLPYPLPWTEELARFLFLWIVFLGAAYITRNNGHIAINFLVNYLPDNIRLAVFVVMQMIIMFFLVVVVWVGVDLVGKVWKLPTIALGSSSAWEYSAVPVACTLMVLRIFFNTIHVLRFGLSEASEASLL